MTRRGRFTAKIVRHGRKCEVKVRNQTGTNSFGNPVDEYVSDRTVSAMRTYPNRNTTVESDAGDRPQDRPVFLVPNGDNHPQPPQTEDVLVYDGQEYEVQAHTDYDSHVEFFGKPIIHNE